MTDRQPEEEKVNNGSKRKYEKKGARHFGGKGRGKIKKKNVSRERESETNI